MQILETKEVKKYYPTPSGIVRALDGVSLSVKEGTFGAIVGSSGSGKTTLLHMLGGLDEPTDGQIWVRGTALKGMSGEEKTVFRRRCAKSVKPKNRMMKRRKKNKRKS